MQPTKQQKAERDAKRELRELRKHLKGLTGTVKAYVSLMDKLMKQPSTVERGKTIANMMNELELANDRARHFGLGERLGS